MVSLLLAIALAPSLRAAPAEPAPPAENGDDGTLWDYVEADGEEKPARIGPLR